MKLNDAVIGSILAIAGIAIVAESRTYPTLPGHSYGSGDFPSLVGFGLIISSILLIVSNMRALISQRRSQAETVSSWIEWPKPSLTFVSLVCAGLFMIFLMDRLGFIMSSFISMCVMQVVFRVGIVRSVIISAIFTLMFYWVFGYVFRVPLPGGIISSIV